MKGWTLGAKARLVFSTVVAGMLLAEVVYLAVVSKPADAAFPGENGDLAFVASNALGPTGFPLAPTIFVRSRDGSQYSPLVGSDNGVSKPSWSADGEKIAFVREGLRNNDELWVMDADGSDVVRLTKSRGYNRDPAWFPDGRRIAVSSNRRGDADVYVLALNGARDDVVGSTQLTNRDSTDSQPAVSPSGRKLAFVSDRNGGEAAIYSMRTRSPEGPNGRNRPLRLTENGEGLDPDTDPDWAPRGQRIVFTSGQDGRNPEVHVMDADGGQEDALTNGLSFEAFQPAFSPDGQKIAFVRCCPDTLGGSIWTMDRDGSNPADAITGGPFIAFTFFNDPAWQPVSSATEGAGE